MRVTQGEERSKQDSVATVYEMGLLFTCPCSVVLLYVCDAGNVRDRRGTGEDRMVRIKGWIVRRGIEKGLKAERS